MASTLGDTGRRLPLNPPRAAASDPRRDAGGLVAKTSRIALIPVRSAGSVPHFWAGRGASLAREPATSWFGADPRTGAAIAAVPMRTSVVPMT